MISSDEFLCHVCGKCGLIGYPGERARVLVVLLSSPARMDSVVLLFHMYLPDCFSNFYASNSLVMLFCALPTRCRKNVQIFVEFTNM